MSDTLTPPILETLAHAADLYREMRLKSDPDILKSLANGLKENVKDHDGRWLYELLQNAEDAGAPKCEFIVSNESLIVSDNGIGIPSSAIKSLSLPHTTTKQSGESIGQKGIGFCSIYELTDNPIIWSNGSGIKFCKVTAEQQLSNMSELDTKNYPYIHTLIPFSVYESPPILQTLSKHPLKTGTQLILPLFDNIDTEYLTEQFNKLDPRFLLTFKSLGEVTFTIGKKVIYALRKEEEQTNDDPLSKNFTLQILRHSQKEETRRFKLWTKNLTPPESVLKQTVKTPTDHDRLLSVDTSLIYELRSPVGVQTTSLNKLFVYYPTEQDIPLDVIIHGDFILDGSRKHLTKHSQGSFNHWLLEQSIQLLVETTNRYIQQGDLLFALKLIRISGEPRDFHAHLSTLESILDSFKVKLLSEILLPTKDGDDTPLQDVVFPDSSLAYRDSSLPLITLIYPEKSLACDELCTPAIQRSISAYSDKWIKEVTLFNKLKSPPGFIKSTEAQIDWSIKAWQWLSNGLNEPSGFVKTPPYLDCNIIPAEEKLHTSKGSSSLPCLVENDDDLAKVPTWLEISALPSQFNQWFKQSNKLCKLLRTKLGIQKFSERFIVEAFSKFLSMPQYQEAEDKVFEQSLDFALERKWHMNPELEQFDWKKYPIKKLRLPSTLSVGSTTRYWTPAFKSYIGADWGNPDLDVILPIDSNYPRVSPQLKEQHPDIEQFLKICGTNMSPPPLEVATSDENLKGAFWNDIRELLASTLPNKSYNPEYHNNLTPKFKELSQLNPADLSNDAASSLLRMLHNQWSPVYESSCLVGTLYTHYSSSYRYKAPNLWVRNLKENLIVPSDPGSLIAGSHLGFLWVHTAETPVWAKKLFPKLNSKSIYSDPTQQQEFESWIIETPFVKSQTKHLTSLDWSEHISPAINDFVTNSELELDEQIHIISLYYRALIDYLPHSTKRPATSRIALFENQLQLFPLDQPIWITSSKQDFSTWQKKLPVFILRKEDLKLYTLDHFKFRKLDDEVSQHLNSAPTNSLGDLSAQLQAHATWIYAYRSHENKKPPVTSAWRSMKFFVTETISVSKTIGDIGIDTSDPFFFDSDQNTLYITQDALNQHDVYAAALVKALSLPESDVDRIELLLGFNEEKRIERLTKEMSKEEFLTNCAAYTGAEIVTAPAKAPIKEPLSEDPSQIATPPSPLGDNTPRDIEATNPDSPRGNGDAAEVELHKSDTDVDMLTTLIPSQSSTRKGPAEPRIGYRENVDSSSLGSRIPKNVGATETLSRVLVERKLRELEYKVVQMAQQNEGYDITATKGDQILLIEVKGNTGATSSIYLTPAEKRLAESPDEGKQWQLWHVSKLQKSSEIPEIRVYDTLTPSALHAPKFIVDLSLLEQIQPS